MYDDDSLNNGMSSDIPNNNANDGVSVHAGFPNPATDTSLHTLDFNQLLITHTASTFMFRIRGHEWEDIGVFDGDIAVIDRALDPRKTDVVIWWQEDHENFALSYYNNVPPTATVWGVITATVHQFRKSQNQNQRHEQSKRNTRE